MQCGPALRPDAVGAGSVAELLDQPGLQQGSQLPRCLLAFERKTASDVRYRQWTLLEPDEDAKAKRATQDSLHDGVDLIVAHGADNTNMQL